MSIKSAYEEIDALFDTAQINDATYQTAADWIELCDLEEQADEESVAYSINLYTKSSPEDLKKIRLEDVISWKGKRKDEIDQVSPLILFF